MTVYLLSHLPTLYFLTRIVLLLRQERKWYYLTLALLIFIAAGFYTVCVQRGDDGAHAV